jgi:acetyltransferase
VAINSTNHSVSWARVAATRDNMTYRIRPICVADAERERAFIMGLSPESRYSRMMFSLLEPPSDLVDRFVRIDYHHNMAFVAVVGKADDERIIGVSRYAADGEGYEFAVAVTDDWQAKGVGGTLSRLLLEYARLEGLPALHARILAGNHRMIELARQLGMSVVFTLEDPTTLKASISL